MGLTGFKKASEYIISGIFLVSGGLLVTRRDKFEKDVLQLLTLSIALMIAAELAFTFYVSVYRLSNLVGHFFKILSFLLVYRAIVETGFSKPYGLIFREMKKNEEALLRSQEELELRVKERTAELDRANQMLREEALERDRSLRFETALRQIDEKILGGANFREALDIACDAIVEMGYRMCWVGLAEPDYTIRPVAFRGFDGGFLTELQLRWDESPQGNVPAGIAIRTERTYVCPDIPASSLYGPWREKAEKVGYRSSATIPMKSTEGTIGCLTVFNEHVGDLPPEEVRNLETFAQQCTIVLLNSRRLEELRETTRRLAFHVNRMPLGYIAHDREFRIVGWNPAAERIFGWSSDEATGKHPFGSIVPPEMQAHVSGNWSKLREGDDSSGDSVGPPSARTARRLTASGSARRCGMQQGAMTGLITLVHDITEKVRLEKQPPDGAENGVRGNACGGIAHDFNNSLTGIVGFGELLRMRMAGDEQAVHDLDEILRCAERASTLTRQLLTYARRQVIEFVNLNLSTLVADLMKLIGKVVGEHIEVKTSLEKNVPTIRADRGQPNRWS